MMLTVAVRGIALLGLALGVLLNSVVHARAQSSAFECPTMIEGTTPAKRAEIRKILPTDDALDDPTQLNASIDELRRLGLSQISIINHLIGAYCPVVFRNDSLSDAERAASVRQFAGKITALVRQQENITGIILNVTLEPPAVDKINARAKATGLSVDQWLSRTIEAALR